MIQVIEKISSATREFQCRLLKPSVVLIGLMAIVSCTHDRTAEADDYNIDSDGDGISDAKELNEGTDKNNPCDPIHAPGYNAFDANNPIWLAGDCDFDGNLNSAELISGTDPYMNEAKDTDGDGLKDGEEISNGTDWKNPCDPLHNAEYNGFNASNSIWSQADCDGDGIPNGVELSLSSNPYVKEVGTITIPEFLPKLSQLKLFKGDMAMLELGDGTYEYEMATPLFTDYSSKLRSISMPEGKSMVYNGEGLLVFPDNTILAKTFFYPKDARNPALGNTILETRVLIKKNGVWEVGNYVWDQDQNDADLDEASHIIAVNWINEDGENKNLNYEIPSKNLCTQCHTLNGNVVPVGPKARTLNMVHKGKNQLQHFIDEGILLGAPNVSTIPALPAWDDTEETLDKRARAYLDINCAHCHQQGGSYNVNFGNSFDFRYELSLEESNIEEKGTEIHSRMNSMISSYFMPLIGTTVIHEEGVALVNEYIDSLEAGN